MRTTKRMHLAVAGAAALVCGAAALPASAAGPADGLDRYYSQTIDWHSCALGPDDTTGQELDAAGARCADLTVPLDYADPEGRTLTVAVSRLAASDPGERVGPLLLNNGGPGGAGLDMPLTVGRAMGKVADKYDLIGVDPRFVGRSTPLDCGWDIGTSVFSAGADRAAFKESVAIQRELADRCERTNGAVLPYVTTRNTARDMDVLRGALGERKISYLGYSYGSYLGQVYTQLFPGRTDRMVLDGVPSPAQYSQTLLSGNERAAQDALRAWASWAAERDAVYGLGATRAQVLATVDRVLDAAAEEPLRIGDFTVDEHFAPLVFFIPLGSDLEENRAVLAEMAVTLAKAADGEPDVRPDPVLEEILTFLLTDQAAQQASVQTAVICGDVAERRGINSYWKAVRSARAVSPVVGPIANNISACEFWDTPVEKPTVISNDVPALLVNATGDTRTRYESAQQVRAQWPSSRLVTVAGARQHGIFGEYGNACADRQVNTYLDTGRLPSGDVTCRK
ncbi:alpha/beta fold hydrolase [Streptomyces sp. NPDC004610]|uniref:alpha/beta fold hydrolase n=1 Tax=unclassified Streptomyces TaxID=2593676 RepID=UPI0033A6F496